MCAARPVRAAVRPLQTALIGPLDGSRVKPGAAVLLRVLTAWSEPGCTLQPGGLVKGHVVSVVRRSKLDRNGTMQIALQAADCDGQPERPRAFSLVALVGGVPDTDPTRNGLVQSPPLARATGVAVGSGAGGGTGALRSISSASANTFIPSSLSIKLPTTVRTGDVLGVARTTLGIGRGSDGATEIAAASRDVRLESGTILLLLPRETETAADPPTRDPAPSGASPPAAERSSEEAATGHAPAAVASALPATAAAAPEPAPPEPPDETEVCSGVCTVVERTEQAGALQRRTATATLPLGTLGFLPRERRRGPAFDEETTLTWLDAHHLLCTFDPHHLRRRTGQEEEAVRTVRAVLIDPAAHATRRVIDWRVRGDEQYLWRVPGGRVLVHMGQELRMFDSELKPLRAIPVVGRVAWVSVSPAGDHFAVGTVREMHSANEHRQLEDLAIEPEERVEVRVLDATLREMVHTERSSRSPAPVLSEGGELRVQQTGTNRWAISLFGWDQMERPVATTKSICPPTLSTPESGLIFAVGCVASGGRWYRMLRGDGHPLLKGESPSYEIEQTARASQAGIFAVRVIKATRSMSYGQIFARADLAREELAVYRSSNGASVEAIATEDFAPSEEAFAIAPAGDQIALVGRSAIQFYAVKH